MNGERHQDFEDFYGTTILDVVLASRRIKDLRLGAVEHGTILSQNGRPAAGGLRCERIFGPAHDARWGYIELPADVVHPVVVPLVAQLLGLDSSKVESLARSESGGEDEGLRSMLSSVDADALPPELRDAGLVPQDLVFDVVPVPPPGLRPLVLGDGGDRVPGAIDRELSRIIDLSSRLSRLMELQAPRVIILTDLAKLQRSFEALVRLMSSGEVLLTVEVDESSQGLLIPRGAPESLGGGDVDNFGSDPTAPHPECPLDIALFGPTSVAVVFPGGTVAVGVEQDLSVFPGVTGSLRGQSAEGRHLVLSGIERPGVFDTHRKQWTSGWPKGLQPWLFFEGQEEGALVDPLTGASFRMFDLGDYPHTVTGSPDGRYLWVEDKHTMGGVYRTRDGALQAVVSRWLEHTGELPRITGDGDIGTAKSVDELQEELGSRNVELEDQLGFDGYRPDAALVLHPEDGFRVFRGGIVAWRERARLFIEIPCLAAAFDRSSRYLALTDDRRVTIVDVVAPAVVTTFDLAPGLEALRSLSRQ